jgi:pimeloyl-ACP methyl ester carboxylesterase
VELRKKSWRIGIILIVIVVVLLIGPLIIPVPPLKNTQPFEALADPDSQFIEVHGVTVHYKDYGKGGPAIILLHGFGASTFSWRNVTGPLSQTGRVIAYDRPAFGLTERPMPGEWKTINPYSPVGNVELLSRLMDELHIQKAILIGNSAGGRVAVEMALAHPERVISLVLVDAAIYSSGNSLPPVLSLLLNTPQADRWGPYFVRSIAGKSGDDLIHQAWHNPALITPDIIAGYRKPLNTPNWDRALWEFNLAGSNPEDLAPQLKNLKMPVLVMTGDDDRIIPTALSLKLGKEIPGATLAVIPACGHVPQEECPQLFLDAVDKFLQ